MQKESCSCSKNLRSGCVWHPRLRHHTEPTVWTRLNVSPWCQKVMLAKATDEVFQCNHRNAEAKVSLQRATAAWGPRSPAGPDSDLTCAVLPQRSQVALICNWRRTNTLAQTIFRIVSLKYVFKRIIESLGPDSVCCVAAQLLRFSGTSSQLCCYWSLFHFLRSLSLHLSSTLLLLWRSFAASLPLQPSLSPPALYPLCSPLCVFISPSLTLISSSSVFLHLPLLWSHSLQMLPYFTPSFPPAASDPASLSEERWQGSETPHHKNPAVKWLLHKNTSLMKNKPGL